MQARYAVMAGRIADTSLRGRCSSPSLVVTKAGAGRSFCLRSCWGFGRLAVLLSIREKRSAVSFEEHATKLFKEAAGCGRGLRTRKSFFFSSLMSLLDYLYIVLLLRESSANKGRVRTSNSFRKPSTRPARLA